MPLTLTKVHVSEKIPGGEGQSRVVRTNHYIRVCAEGSTPLYIQNGAVYSEGGAYCDNIPDWFWIEVNKLTAHALDSVNYQIPEGKKGIFETPEPVPASSGRRRR